MPVFPKFEGAHEQVRMLHVCVGRRLTRLRGGVGGSSFSNEEIRVQVSMREVGHSVQKGAKIADILHYLNGRHEHAGRGMADVTASCVARVCSGEDGVADKHNTFTVCDKQLVEIIEIAALLRAYLRHLRSNYVPVNSKDVAFQPLDQILYLITTNIRTGLIPIYIVATSRYSHFITLAQC